MNPFVFAKFSIASRIWLHLCVLSRLFSSLLFQLDLLCGVAILLGAVGPSEERRGGKENELRAKRRDARVGTMYEGTSEIQRLIIGRFLAGKIRF